MLFDPGEWARLAKLAGMEYVVFTAKHHDGFRMFDTALSDFKITNTPYGRDITALVAEAFRREGLAALVQVYCRRLDSAGSATYHASITIKRT